MSVRLDIVLFGATGFTGKHVIPELKRLIELEEPTLKWGVAGRSKSKMNDLIDEISKSFVDDYSDVAQIIADTNDENALKNMTAQAHLIINVTGPYRFYGEPVVKACIATGTHYVDITGEPQFMEMIQLKYHKAALDKGIYVLSSCGFDSIPADLGVVFLQKEFEGTLNSVETYMSNRTVGKPLPGAVFNYATWESAIHGLTHSHELRTIRKKLFPNKLPPFKPKLHSRGAVHKSDVINSWAIPFIGADRSVILRSQQFFYENNKQRPIQIHSYFGIGSLYNAFLYVVFGTIISLFCKNDYTRNLLLKNPKFFTNGIVSFDEPPQEKLESTQGEIILNGKGWTEKQSGPNDEYKTPPTKTIIGKVTGMNPGYGATCTAVVLSAITVLKEADKMPNNGGVYPPGAAFARTSLIEKLHKHGLTFEIISKL